MTEQINASIVGITGFTGIELFRFLELHPNVNLKYLTSRTVSRAPIGDIIPHLAGYPYAVTNTDLTTVADESDVVFLALPHKTAQDAVAELYSRKTLVIDLSADYRLDSAEEYSAIYGVEHNHPELFKQAVYGVPEFDSEPLKNARIIANPGCFALLCQFLLYPFAGLIESAEIMAVTGSSGAGKKENARTHHPIRNHNMYSYKINAHRHTPEILRTAKISREQLNFVPTSGPFTRGIFATAFIRLKESMDKLQSSLQVYENKPFLRLRDEVSLANIVGSNFVDLNFRMGQSGTIIAQGCLDNVVKGSGGNAVQCMNIAFGWPENLGLSSVAPLFP